MLLQHGLMPVCPRHFFIWIIQVSLRLKEYGVFLLLLSLQVFHLLYLTFSFLLQLIMQWYIQIPLPYVELCLKWIYLFYAREEGIVVKWHVAQMV